MDMKIFSRLAMAAGMTIAVMAVSGCGSNGRFGGTLTGIESDSLMVMAYHVNDRTPAYVDTVALENDRFSITFKDTSLLIMSIAPMPKTGAASVQPAPVLNELLVLLPGDNIKVSGSIDKPVFRSPMLYDDIAAFAEHGEILKMMEALNEKAKTIEQNDTESLEALADEFEAAIAYKDSVFAAYAAANPDKLSSGYLVLHINDEQIGLDAHNALGEKVRNGVMKEILDRNAENNERQIRIKENEAKMQPGMPAPEFSLKDLEGETRTLASFRGKYVLLDFWGKWCYWCMKGMPDMKEYYAKYHRKIEFVGINCRDSEETWRETVETEGLKWTNLFNGDGKDVVDSYAIKGYPTKVLIDPQGNIVEVFVGESEELYKKLDELF